MYMSTKNRNLTVKTEKETLRGSVTVETSLSLFLFLMFFICMMYFYIVLDLEINMQSALEETADIQAAYAAVKDYHDEDGTFSYIQCGLDHVFARSNIVRLLGNDYLDTTWIDGGSNGLHFGKSNFFKDGITLDLVVSYKIKIPFFSVADINIVQSAHRRAWLGDDTSRLNDPKTTEKSGTSVYVTPNGVAYHLYADCSYIDVKLQAVSSVNVAAKRNKDGSRYYPCESCHPKGEGVVYITIYGTRYHCSETCSAIEKEAVQIDVEDVKNRHLCSKCAERAG